MVLTWNSAAGPSEGEGIYIGAEISLYCQTQKMVIKAQELAVLAPKHIGGGWSFRRARRVYIYEARRWPGLSS